MERSLKRGKTNRVGIIWTLRIHIPIVGDPISDVSFPLFRRRRASPTSSAAAAIPCSGPLPILLSFSGQALRAVIHSCSNSPRSSSPSVARGIFVQMNSQIDFCRHQFQMNMQNCEFNFRLCIKDLKLRCATMISPLHCCVLSRSSSLSRIAADPFPIHH